MEILNFINLYLIKYLYIAVIIGIIASLIYLFIKGLLPLVNTLNGLLNSINNVNEDITNIKNDLEKISYTLNNSVPLFVDIAFYIIIIKSIYKDYRNTKLSKRSLIKSTVKEYSNVTRKHNRKFDVKLLLDIISLIKRIVA